MSHGPDKMDRPGATPGKEAQFEGIMFRFGTGRL